MQHHRHCRYRYNAFLDAQECHCADWEIDEYEPTPIPYRYNRENPRRFNVQDIIANALTRELDDDLLYFPIEQFIQNFCSNTTISTMAPPSSVSSERMNAEERVNLQEDLEFLENMN